MRVGCPLACVAAVALAFVVGAAQAQQQVAPAANAPQERLAADLREEIQRVEVAARDLYGREERRSIAVTVFRPNGEGPFPLAIVNHGRGLQAQRASQGRQRFEDLARYLVSKGFVVAVPTRIGYGDTYGAFDPEDAGRCGAPRVEPMSLAASGQVLQVLEHLRTLPYVDTARWVALGQSVGGLTTVALAWRNPPGLVVAVNFSGGFGGNPAENPGEPCAPQQTERLWRAKAAEAKVPMLWIYWETDLYWGPNYPRQWAKAWAEGGAALEFHMLAPWTTDKVDGHFGISAHMNGWVPLVEAFFARHGFSRSGIVVRPPATAFARVDEVDKVPVDANRREQLYQRFLAAPKPRAFAIGPDGVAGWARGDWAIGRALGYCAARRGQPCRLYAVDDDVVWSP